MLLNVCLCVHGRNYFSLRYGREVREVLKKKQGVYRVLCLQRIVQQLMEKLIKKDLIKNVFKNRINK